MTSTSNTAGDIRGTVPTRVGHFEVPVGVGWEIPAVSSERPVTGPLPRL
jgi:hypothetical protein